MHYLVCTFVNNYSRKKERVVMLLNQTCFVYVNVTGANKQKAVTVDGMRC
jgi:hypothetical protein